MQHCHYEVQSMHASLRPESIDAHKKDERHSPLETRQLHWMKLLCSRECQFIRSYKCATLVTHLKHVLTGCCVGTRVCNGINLELFQSMIMHIEIHIVTTKHGFTKLCLKHNDLTLDSEVKFRSVNLILYAYLI